MPSRTRRPAGADPALGADARRVVKLFCFRGLRLSFLGLLVGLALSGVVLRLLAVAQEQSLPSGVVFIAAIVAVVVVTVAIIATWIPARRAATFDPLTTLRAD